MKRSARKGRARVAGASGQALVPALIFLLVGGLSIYVAFNSFQMTSAKIKLQNTADAAAYSAALLQARDYNFSAYTNRAMIANQVTAAQIVGLKSWIDELDNRYGATPDVDGLIQAFADHPEKWSGPKRRGKDEIEPVRITLDALLPIAARDIGTIIRGLDTAQTNFHAGIFTAVPQAANTVAQANQADTFVTAGFFTSPRNTFQLAAWKNYTQIKSLTGQVEDDRFAEVLTNRDTLDAFTKNRRSTASMAPDYMQLDDSANKICRSQPGTIVARVEHEGGTQLRRDKKGWQAIDASLMTVSVSCIGGLSGEPMTVGRAGAANGNLPSYRGKPSFLSYAPYVSDTLDWTGYGGYINFGADQSGKPGRVPNAVASQMGQGPGLLMDPQNGGLLPYQDIVGTPTSPEAPRITIELERKSGTLTKTVGLQGAGRMRAVPTAAGEVLRALSSANAYFVRPNEGPGSALKYGLLYHSALWQRTDGKTEYPSTFNPYWQAHLAPVREAERQAAWVDQIPASDY
ncbi:pilus assembly protein TadG-related protein [Paraburkholderia hayleyella]|uniref:pilus assembly protein TadG-related protein n=1 Tax=Paraburkholderia hayleyella TaxID=2152889 RepID=UPI0012909CAB|nr:pilus assembly protein TadG-related protein [Paraburkholderia hayleyella]